VGNAGGRGELKDGWFVHNSLDVKEYLVKAKLHGTFLFKHAMLLTAQAGCAAEALAEAWHGKG